jgi:hypothetical protein
VELVTDLGSALLLAVVVLGATGFAAGWNGPGLMVRAARIDPSTLAVVLAVSVAVVAVTGSAALLGGSSPELLVINEEQTLPAYFGSALLLVAGALALGIGAARMPGEPLWPWLLLGLVLLFLGLDEAAELHERLETRTGLPAPVVLAPVALAAFVGFAGIAPRLRATPPALALFVAGAIAWAISQALDPIHAVDWKSAIEETLELIGSALFLLSLHTVARDLSRR